MVLRRTDSRRRRLVVDPAKTSESATSVEESQVKPKRSRDSSAYGYGADRRNQLKTTDLVPKRPRSVGFVVVALAILVGLLNYLSVAAPAWEPFIGTDGVNALALYGPGTLNGWLCSVLMMLGAMACWQIYALRKHRRDDYRGSYRLWFVMSIVCLTGSMVCSADIGSIAIHLLGSLTGYSSLPNSWIVPGVLILALTGLTVRVAFEVRQSNGTLAMVAVAWLGFLALATLHIPSVHQAATNLDDPIVNDRFLLGNTLLVGGVGMLIAQLTYARFIFLHAHGLIQPAVRQKTKVKSKPKKSTKTQAKAKKTTKSQAKPASKSKGGATRTTKPKSSQPAKPTSRSNAKTKSPSKPAVKKTDGASKSNVGDNDSEDANILKMSKSKRRKLRKQQQQKRRAA